MNHRTSTWCAALIACAVPGFAMQTPGSAPTKPQQPGTTQQPAAPATATQRSALQLHRGDRLIGTELKDQAGGRIGRIEDLILRPDGRIGYVVVDSGTQLVPIPWSSVQSSASMPGATDKPGATPERADLVARIDPAKLKGAPGFEKGSWPKESDMAIYRETDAYFGGAATPPGATGKPTEAGAATGMSWRSSQLGNQSVVDSQGNAVGTLNQIVYDPVSGRANYVAVSLSNVAGASGRVIAVPWELLRSTRKDEKTVFTLAVPADRLQAAPQFQASDDKRMSDPAWATEVYQYYSLKPYWSDKEMPKDPKKEQDPKGKDQRPPGE
jgi:sporulation protein YlmC with PRC-barrel domain